MRSHVRTGWCQLTLAGPDPSITWLSIAAHPPTLGSLRPWPVGSPTSYHHRLSHGSLSQISSEKKKSKHRKVETIFSGLLRVYLDWRQYYVIWRPVASPASWPGELWSPEHHGTRGQVSADQGQEADQEPPVVTTQSRDTGEDDRRSLRLGRGRVWCLWTGAWLRTEAGTVTGDWGWAARPLLPTLSSGNIRTSQPGPAWLGLPTKYSRFFSPLKCVLKLLSFKTLAHRGSITQLKEERKGWSDHIQTEKLSCLSICRVIFQETGIVICLSECKKHGWGMFGPGTFDLWPRGREVRSVWMFGEWSPRRPGAQR